MKLVTSLVCPIAAALTLFAGANAYAQGAQSIFPLLPPSVSTVPANGDVNPYGVAFVPKTVPRNSVLQPGDILVSNFNNAENLQGTGTTIIRVDKAGNVSTFYAGSQLGLSAALGILSNGWVLVGSLPTADGTAATAQAGSVALIDANGNLLGQIKGPGIISGPWGMAIHDLGNGFQGRANVFVSNVLSGTVVRLDVTYQTGQVAIANVVLATGFNHRPDPAALELGPSGLSYDAIHDTLYVASSTDNAIYKIDNAVKSTSAQTPVAFVQDPVHLHGPLDLTILPNGHLLVANSDGSNVDPNQPSELVEYTADGEFVAQMSVDPNNGGAFGVAVNNLGWGTLRLAAVDDNANALKIWTTVVNY